MRHEPRSAARSSRRPAPRHGGHQPPARLRRRGRDAAGRRQRHRRGDRGAVHADRRRADDGRHPRRRHGAYPAGRTARHVGHRRAVHRAARARGPTCTRLSDDAARHAGHDGPRERRRPAARSRRPATCWAGARRCARFGTLLAGRCHGSRRSATPRAASASRPTWRECVADCAADLARDPEIAGALPAGRHAARGRARGWCSRRLCRDPAQRSPAKGRTLLYGGALGAALRRPHGAARAANHARPTSTRYRTDRARGGARHAIAAIEIVGPPPPSSGRRAHHPDAEHPGGLRHRRLGFGTADDAAPARRSAEDRLRRPRRRDRRPGLRRRAGREAAVQGLCRGAPRAASTCTARAGLDRRGRRRRRRATPRI